MLKVAIYGKGGIGRFADEPARWGTVKTGHELYERGR